MKKKDLVSVIVPVYQVEKYIDKCIQSILKQTYQNIEVILVDDGSSDQSGSICDRYACMDNRIQVIHKKNGGLAAARNSGAAAARGDWYCFIDSDDYIAPDYIEYLLTLCQINHADMSCCMYDIVYETPEKQDNNIKKDQFDEIVAYAPEEFTYLLLCDKIASYAWNKLYRASLWSDIGFNEAMKIYEDSTTLYKVASKANKIICGSGIKYYYVQRQTSLLHNNKNMRNILNYFSVLNEQENYVKSIEISTIKPVPFDLLRLENSRRYLNYCVDHGIDIDSKIVDWKKYISDKNQIKKILKYRDVFDKKSVFSNILLLISPKLYLWQRAMRHK